MNKIEQASWLWKRPAWILKSLYNFTRISVSTLVDGAHLWFPWEGILIPFYNRDLRKVDLWLYWVKHGMKIAASNPGIQIVASSFLIPQITGDVLAILEWKKFHTITHVEAENEWLLAEKWYYDIFTYNGDIDGRFIFQKMRKQERKLVENTLTDSAQQQILETLRDVDSFQTNVPELPETAYQVTKKWSGQIFLLNSTQFSR